MFTNIDSERKNKLTRLFEQSPFWTTQGVFFGFPDCCIEGFVNDTNMETKNKYTTLASDGSGYVPCICCAPKVKQDWREFRERFIYPNRLSSLEFPFDYNDNETFSFFNKFASFLGFDAIEIATTYEREDVLEILFEQDKLRNMKHHVNNKFLSFIKNNPEFTFDELESFLFSEKSIDKYVNQSLKSMMKDYLIDRNYWDNLENLENLENINDNCKHVSIPMIIKDKLKYKLSVVCHVAKYHSDTRKIANFQEDLVEGYYHKLYMGVANEIYEKETAKLKKNSANFAVKGKSVRY